MRERRLEVPGELHHPVVVRLAPIGVPGDDRHVLGLRHHLDDPGDDLFDLDDLGDDLLDLDRDLDLDDLFFLDDPGNDLLDRNLFDDFLDLGLSDDPRFGTSGKRRQGRQTSSADEAGAEDLASSQALVDLHIRKNLPY